MEARQRLVAPAWTGFLLIVIGFLSFVGSYFLLPVVVIYCFDTCTISYTYATAWEMSMRALSVLPDLPAGAAFTLLLCYLPPLAAVTVVGCSIGFLVHPHRTFATWNHRAWVAGISVLGLAFPFLFFFILRPGIGCGGMLFGYGLLWGGNRFFLTARP